jgi:3-oxoacyl-[acyl-carrier protein] reductase
MSEFAGQVVFVSGAGRGIGRAVAGAFAERGARLLLVDRSEQVLEAAAEIGRMAEVEAVRCDVTGYGQVEHAVAQAIGRWGRIDVLVNAAAVLGATGELWTTDPERWRDALRVNLEGTYHTLRAVLPHMVAARRGKVVNFAGGGAAYSYPRFSAYAASKVAVVRLTETVAEECAPWNVQVNVIAPGAIETALLEQVRAAGGEVRTLGSMEEAVAVVLFLASRDADHLSGRFIHARDAYRDFRDLPPEACTLRRVQP